MEDNTDILFDRASLIYVKTCSVINSCITPKHIEVAKRYCNIAILELEKLNPVYSFSSTIINKINLKDEEVKKEYVLE